MTQRFILAFLTTLARALLAHCCGEVFRMILEYLLPGASPLVCLASGLMISVVFVEAATTFWHRRSHEDSDDDHR